jgi:hypothetical protein
VASLFFSLRGPSGDEPFLAFDFVESQLQGVQLVAQRGKTMVLDRAKATMGRGEFRLDGAQRTFGGGVARGCLEGSKVGVA